MENKIVQVPATEEFIETLKEATNQKTGSKAFLVAAWNFQDDQRLIASQKEEISDLQEQITVYKQIIEEARSAAAALLEKAGQKHFFIDN